MIGRIILGLFVLIEILVHIFLWGKDNPASKKIGFQTLMVFVIDTIIVIVGVKYW